MAKPNLTYVMCTGLRTGSTLLAQGLEATGRAGRPDEYFDINPENEQSWVKRLGIRADAEYVDKVIEAATTLNGVCGLKVHQYQAKVLQAKLVSALNGNGLYASASLADLIQAKFGDVRYVWMLRRNKVAQAISYYRAVHSGIWRSYDPKPTTRMPEFDFTEIDRAIGLCMELDRGWESFFRGHRVAPLVLIYEDFVQRYETTVRGVIRFLGLGELEAPLAAPRLEQQADQTSLEWEQRYRALKGTQTPRDRPATGRVSQIVEASANASSKRNGPAPPGAAAVAATPTPMSLAYIICTEPRTGSTLLADGLARIGLAGRPDEYFTPDREYWRRHFGVREQSEYIDKVIEATTTPNGVFGFKLHWDQCEPLHETLRAAVASWETEANASVERLLRYKLGAPRYIWLRRKNKVAQAISYYRAAHTGIWRAIPGRNDQANVPDKMLEFDFAEIDGYVTLFSDWEWRWDEFFKTDRITPLMIFYEDFVANFETTIRGVLMFLGVPHEEIAVVTPDLERQADARSLEWERRYREMKGEAAIATPALAASTAAAAAGLLAAQPSTASGPARAAAASTQNGASVSEVMAARARAKSERPALAAASVEAAVGKDKGSKVGASPRKRKSNGASDKDTAVADGSMKLLCYSLRDQSPKLQAAHPQREWMDDFPDRHAYRCLPLTIANAHGWEVLCPIPIQIDWNGGPAISDLSVRPLKPLPGNYPIDHFCRSNFSRGIVTFHLEYVFRTDPGWDLLATGPFNRPKENAYPLTGIMEADWLPYPFTMNWQILRPGRILFEEGEPYCFIFPVKKQVLVDCVPEIRRMSDNPELNRQHDAFRDSREEFMKRFRAGDSATIKQAWQRHYFVGRHPDGTQVEEHMNKLRLKEPIDRRTEPAGATVSSSTADRVREEKRSDPKWEDDSLLNRIALHRSDRNEAGRQRIDGEGHLLDRSKTRLVRSSRDAVGCDFLVVDDLLTGEQCDILCRTFRELEDKIFKSDQIDPFWNNRFINFLDIASARPVEGKLMLQTQRRAIGYTKKFYRLKAPIYPDLLQIVRWKTGMFMPPHADNANPNGSEHKLAYRAMSGIVYLNDDYDGGEFYFTGLDIAVKPRRGMFLAITGGFHHEHAVLRVDSGTRLTMPSFFTFDTAKAARPLMEPRILSASAASVA